MITKINKSQITKIVIVSDLTEDTDYRYNEEVKFLWITFLKEGFYCYGSHIDTDVINNSDDSCVKDNKVFILPHITIHTSDGKTEIIYFKTSVDLNWFLDVHLGGLSWIIV